MAEERPQEERPQEERLQKERAKHRTTIDIDATPDLEKLADPEIPVRDAVG